MTILTPEQLEAIRADRERDDAVLTPTLPGAWEGKITSWIVALKHRAALLDHIKDMERALSRIVALEDSEGAEPLDEAIKIAKDALQGKVVALAALDRSAKP